MMNKEQFQAVFGGECYIKGYRTLYQHGYVLQNIMRGSTIVAVQQKIAKIKAFDALDSVADAGKKIIFDAIFDGNVVKYISNVRLI